MPLLHTGSARACAKGEARRGAGLWALGLSSRSEEGLRDPRSASHLGKSGLDAPHSLPRHAVWERGIHLRMRSRRGGGGGGTARRKLWVVQSRTRRGPTRTCCCCSRRAVAWGVNMEHWTLPRGARRVRADGRRGLGGRCVCVGVGHHVRCAVRRAVCRERPRGCQRERGGVWGGGEGGWHKASVSNCLPLAAPIGLSPLLILTLCGPERVLVVSTEPPDDLSCLTTPGVGRPGDGAVARAVDRVHPDAHTKSMRGFADSSTDLCALGGGGGGQWLERRVVRRGIVECCHRTPSTAAPQSHGTARKWGAGGGLRWNPRAHATKRPPGCPRAAAGPGRGLPQAPPTSAAHRG